MVYNIGHSVLKHTGPNPAADDSRPAAAVNTAAETAAEAVHETEAAPVAAAVMEPVAEPVVASVTTSTVLLFKTPTCPNCKAAGALLDKAGVAHRALNANEEKELVGKFGVKQAPTLIVISEDGTTFEKYRGVSDIKGWLMNR